MESFLAAPDIRPFNCWLQLLLVLGRAFFYSKDVFARIFTSYMYRCHVFSSIIFFNFFCRKIASFEKWYCPHTAYQTHDVW